MNKELTKKILGYLNNLENDERFQKLSNKKKDLLTTSREEYREIEKKEKDYQELLPYVEKKEENSLLLDIQKLEQKKQQIVDKVKEQILHQENIKQNILIEIRPGTGGTEAGLFARDLYRMYAKFAENKGWKVEMVESKVDNEGNFTFVYFLVKGKDVFNWLKYEAGVHRVQRVPKTESKGRIHTSTASVVVLPETQDVVLNIRPQDLKIDTYNSGGPGGQHANKTASAVRITHLPTKIVATSQDGRDQRVNRERALFVLKTRILEKLQNEQRKQTGDLRSSMIGTAERAEKIRTYNYPQNRVTDHRLGISWNQLDIIIEGKLEEICQRLIDYEVEQKIQ